MARYGQKFKTQAVAQLLSPESASIRTVSEESGVSVATLERWRADALSMPAREQAWTTAARFRVMIATAAMDEAQCSARCHEQGVYPTEQQQWKESATAALSEIPEARISSQATHDARRLVKELERDLR